MKRSLRINPLFKILYIIKKKVFPSTSVDISISSWSCTNSSLSNVVSLWGDPLCW